MNPMQKPLSLVVLAAGVGSRYGGLKQMEPLGPGGEAVLDYAVFDAKRAGFNRFVFVIRKDIERDFRDLLARRFERHVEVQYAFQERDALPPGFSAPSNRVKPWGTGHATLCAAPVTPGPFAVINADDFYGAASYQVLADYLQAAPSQAAPEAYAMVGFQLDRTLSEHGAVARGVCHTDHAGNLNSVEELTGITRTPDGIGNREANGSLRMLTGHEAVSLNCWGFQPGLFDHLRMLFADFLKQHGQDLRAEFYLPFAINALIQQGKARVKVLPTPCSWFGVTYREDRPRVVEGIRALIRQGAYPERLWVA
ncbi:MAG: nucleotidyltransferase [Verrucomicrobiota bacterium]